jgi:hypothetical protein
MKQRSRLITWDAALLIGIMLFIFWKIPVNDNLIVGLVTVMIFSNCVRSHVTAYKLTGKIY